MRQRSAYLMRRHGFLGGPSTQPVGMQRPGAFPGQSLGDARLEQRVAFRSGGRQQAQALQFGEQFSVTDIAAVTIAPDTSRGASGNR